jgi:hypothetical protein
MLLNRDQIKKELLGKDDRFGRFGYMWFWVVMSGLLLLSPLPVNAGSWSFNLDTSVSGQGDGSLDELKGQHMGSFAEIHTSAEGIGSYNLNDNLVFRLGAGWERFSFLGVREGTAIPGNLQSVNLVTGLNWQVSPVITLQMDLKPGFYGDVNHMATNNFDVPIEAGGAYFVSDTFQIVVGVGIDLFRNIPVIPGAGFRWQVTDKWLINAVLPKPQVTYQLNDAVGIYVGAEFLDSPFRMSGDFGSRNNIKKLNDSILSYEEVHIGGGLAVKLSKTLTLDLNTGIVPYRKFDFDRAGYKLKSTDPVPYGELNLSFKF